MCNGNNLLLIANTSALFEISNSFLEIKSMNFERIIMLLANFITSEYSEIQLISSDLRYEK